MATTYGSRISELRGLLAQVPAAANDDINQAFVECIKRYADMRQSALEDLIDFMSKASAGNLGTQAKWQARIARLRSDYKDLFADSVRDFKLPSSHQLFWATALDAEEKFFDLLSKIEMPQRLDDILQHQDNLSKLLGALQDTWTFLLSTNQGIQNDEMRAMQDLDQMVQRLISDMDESWRKVVDNSGRVVDAMQRGAERFKSGMKDVLEKIPGGEFIWEAAKKKIEDEIKPDGYPDDADGPMKEGMNYVGLMIQNAGINARTYRALLASYKDLVSRQKGSVLTMFNKTRGDIDRYLSTNNVTQARVFLDQARGQVNDWISAVPTTGQKDDGASIRYDFFQKLDIVWKRTEDLDAKFKQQFQGALLSPLSNETIEVLSQRYLFRTQLEKIKDRDAADKLGEIRNDLPDKMKAIEESLHKMDDPVDALPDEVRDFARSRNKDFQAFVHDRIKTQIELLLPVMDDLKNLLTPSNLDSDFNRQELESMLN
jgi:hypothetical protein